MVQRNISVPKWLLFASCLLVQLGFAGYAVLLKKFAQEEKADALVFSTLRDLGAVPVLMIAAICLEGWRPPRSRSVFIMYFILGFFGMLCNQLCYIIGLYFTSPSVAAIMQPTIPIVTTIFATLAGLEPVPELYSPVDLIKVVGIGLSVFGAFVMISSKLFVSAENESSMKGMMFLIGNVSCMSLYIVSQKFLLFSDTSNSSRRCLRKLDGLKEECKMFAEFPITVTAWSYLLGGLLMTLCCIYFAMIGDWERFQIPSKTYIPLIYAIFVSSALCYGLLSWANKHLHSSMVTAMWPSQVPVVALLSYFLFGDVLSMTEVTGGCLIAAGLFCVTWSEYRKSLLPVL